MNIDIDWVDKKRYGNPDESGMYLCAFSDGTVETINYLGDDDDFWSETFLYANCQMTHWAEIPPELHPDYDPSPENQEDVTRIGGWG